MYWILFAGIDLMIFLLLSYFVYRIINRIKSKRKGRDTLKNIYIQHDRTVFLDPEFRKSSEYNNYMYSSTDAVASGVNECDVNVAHEPVKYDDYFAGMVNKEALIIKEIETLVNERSTLLASFRCYTEEIARELELKTSENPLLVELNESKGDVSKQLDLNRTAIVEKLNELKDFFIKRIREYKAILSDMVVYSKDKSKDLIDDVAAKIRDYEVKLNSISQVINESALNSDNFMDILNDALSKRYVETTEYKFALPLIFLIVGVFVVVGLVIYFLGNMFFY